MMSAPEPNLLDTDPVTFEVIKNALYAICADMKSVIMRTSFSPLLSLSADLSCALLDTRCNVVAQGVDIPVHLGAAGLSGAAAVRAFPLETWTEGDAVLLNDPYEGGTHLPDMSLVTPLFGNDVLLGFSISRLHWPDIGGIAAGSSSVCDDIIKEGLRIPPVRIVEKGITRQDLLQLILANVRIPQDRLGDFRAAQAGHIRATERVTALCARYGASVVSAVMAQTQIYSARLVRDRLLKLADAVVEHEESLDGDGINANCRPLIKVRITKAGTSLHVDFTGSSPCVPGPINAPYPVTCAAVYYTVLSFLGGDIAPNAGVYRDVTITAPPGSIVNATNPAPVVAANTETSNRMVDILFGALAKAWPEVVPGGSYGSACVYTLGGADPRSGKRFVHYETVGGGGGATATAAGAHGIRVHMGNTMNLPIENVEAQIPVRFTEYSILRESGGAGRHPGGCGVRKSLVSLADGVQASVLGERTDTPARGAAGAQDGSRASFRLIRGGESVELGAKSGPHVLNTGDSLELNTAGGGGWGSPS